MSFFDDPPIRDFPDHALRRLLENPANLRDLVADLRPDLAERLDFSRAEPEPREFLMEDWRERQCDLFFRIPYRTGEGEGYVLVCILVEHQSSPDPRMPLRTLIYAVSHWERTWKSWESGHRHGEPLRLTPIIPIVFYTGSAPWNAELSLAELFEGPEELRGFAPQWPVLFWDITTRRPEDLLSSTSAWLQALTVVRMEVDEPETFGTAFREVCRRLDELRGNDRMRSLDLLWFVLSWVVRRRPAPEQALLREILRDSASNAGVIMEIERMPHPYGPTLDDLAEERGEKRGAIRTRRNDIRTLLEERFGTVPEAVLQAINVCEDLDRLDTGFRQAIRIQSIDEFQIG